MTSKYKGVHWLTEAKRWQADIMINYKPIYLGIYISDVTAAKAYDKAARRLGRKLNFPDKCPYCGSIIKVKQDEVD